MAIKQLDLSEKQQQKIVDWLYEEIAGPNGALAQRGDKEEKWAKWTQNFEARPEKEIKNFPFERASNLVAPIQSITVNAFVARQYNTFFSVQPFWTVRALNKKWVDHAMPTQRMLDYAQRVEMKMRVNIVSWLYDMANLGAGVVKIPWIVETHQNKRYKADGSIEDYTQQVSNGPRFIPIPRKDFIYPYTSTQDVQRTRWVAHRFRLRWGVIEQRGKTRTYINTDKIENHWRADVNSITDEEEKLKAEVRAINLREYEFYEVWCDYDYDGDGWEERCVFTVNLDAKVLVRATLYPFRHGKRPFLVTPCFPRAHSIDGIGFGQKLERLQDGLTTAINQAIDNATLANTRGYKARRGSGVKPGTKIYAGKVFLLDDMADLEEFRMGDIYPSSKMIFDTIVGLSERTVGVSDYHLGRESPIVGSSATATSTLALIQEGSKLFDFMIKRERVDLSEVASQTYSLYAQFKPNGLVYPLLGDEEGALVEETWNGMQGYEDVDKNLQFDLTASSPHVNKALERESWVTLFNLVLGYYAKLFELGEVMLDPQAPPELKQMSAKMVLSAHTIMERVVERWDIMDVERVLFDPEDLVSLATAERGPEGGQGGGARRAAEEGPRGA